MRSKSAQAVADTGLGRPDGDAELTGDFCGAPFAEVPQHHSVPLFVREVSQSDAQGGAEEQRVALVVVAVDAVVVTSADAELAFPQGFETADPVDRPTMRHGAQPRLQIGSVRIVPIRVLPELEERFVHDVLREVSVDDDGPHESSQSRSVLLVRSDEGGGFGLIGTVCSTHVAPLRCFNVDRSGRIRLPPFGACEQATKRRG
ncbi:hypothetical protein N8D78_15370 [Curtobacterium poinsettiae]|uniref:CheW-like domain-containing protein n=1 Tax=Curtobacterium poinsettiae TaxID=159612 RepID=A0ABT3S489_9MICO|nr:MULTISPECIES: hypothetical protein [Curtobacterium]MCX2849643.1 hypothetical protein [Curtobacterium flaccumfaciens pv. poinsettiae]UXN18199.1 hypothetical protein N8D78_15370 [Curtobacterium flaccumfaciens pv. poinsettiae]